MHELTMSILRYIHPHFASIPPVLIALDATITVLDGKEYTDYGTIWLGARPADDVNTCFVGSGK